MDKKRLKQYEAKLLERRNQLLNMVGNQVLSVIDPDFIGDAAEQLVFCRQHRCTDSRRDRRTRGAADIVHLKGRRCSTG